MGDKHEATSPLDSPDLQEEETSPATSPAVPPPMGARSHSDMPSPIVANMNPSSTPLGTLNAARRPPGGPLPNRGPPQMNADLAARMKAFSLSRAGPAPKPGMQPSGAAFTPAAPAAGPTIPTPSPAAGGIPAGFKLPANLARPQPHVANSSPAAPQLGGLAAKRGMRLPGGLPGAAPPATTTGPGRQKPKMSLSAMGGGPTQENGAPAERPKEQTQIEKYAQYLDPKTGALSFAGKATLDSKGVVFASGKTFSMSLEEVETLDELGKGNYGTVYKVRHSKPKMRKPGQGLAGNKVKGADEEDTVTSDGLAPGVGTGLVMAMKEMRLELEDAKFATIIMELDVLHRCASPYIVDFYGAFFQEGAVYICMEHMDGGSCDKIYGDGIPEGVLRKITLSTTLGLKSLKEEHNIIHRDVKPTNILMNTRGQVKICDFGVSGNLVASVARTNIGCQSYMAPERISGGGVAAAGANPGGGTYSVQSDIWSLGLVIIECALGRYPYPPETYDNIFSQLSAIVDGAPPDLPASDFSEAARDFVAGCLNKIANLRPTYPMLLQHTWLAPLLLPPTITEEDEEAAEAGEELPEGGKPAGDFVDKEVGEWVIAALERKRSGKMGFAGKPALHAAPLDAGMGVGSPQAAKAVAVDA
nr:hypothetical protein B0A51_05120 [Rachicladosporium sp. CCFEE 5018]